MKKQFKRIASLMAILVLSTTFSFCTCYATEGFSQKFERFGATAGTTISVGDILYIAQSDGKAYKCDADAESTSMCVGIAGTNASSGGYVEIVSAGILAGQTAGTPGKRVYSGSTAGAFEVGDVLGMSNSYSQVLGFVMPDLGADTSSTNYYIRVSYNPSSGANETNS